MKYTKPMNETDPNAHYVDANPALGIEGSVVPAAAIEPGMREIVNAIAEAGLTPSENDLTQLAQAIKKLGMHEATNSEIGGGYVAESINDTRDLAFTNAKMVYNAIQNAAGANSIPTYYPGEFKDFFEEEPPEGWAVRDGAVLNNADLNYPELWAELQKPQNAFKLKTLAEWEALSAAAGGVGGVAFFVLDTGNKTIKLPDTRTDFFRDANCNVGAWQGDAIRNITGGYGQDVINKSPYTGLTWGQYGAFSVGREITSSIAAYTPSGNTNTSNYNTVSFNASKVVPTANENRPRNIAMLGCVCVEPAKAQRNEATTTTPGAVYLADGVNDKRANAVLGMPILRENFPAFPDTSTVIRAYRSSITSKTPTLLYTTTQACFVFVTCQGGGNNIYYNTNFAFAPDTTKIATWAHLKDWDASTPICMALPENTPIYAWLNNADSSPSITIDILPLQ